jgi:hypothetical protein
MPTCQHCYLYQTEYTIKCNECMAANWLCSECRRLLSKYARKHRYQLEDLYLCVPCTDKEEEKMKKENMKT